MCNASTAAAIPRRQSLHRSSSCCTIAAEISRVSEASAIYWVSIYESGGAGLDERVPIDRDHVVYSRQCKTPGWEEAVPQFLLAPESIRNAILSSATDH